MPGHIRPKAAHVRLVMCIRGRRQGYPDGAAHYFHDGSIIIYYVHTYAYTVACTYVHTRTHIRLKQVLHTPAKITHRFILQLLTLTFKISSLNLHSFMSFGRKFHSCAPWYDKESSSYFSVLQ